MTYKIITAPGDGIGPEVTAAAVRVLDRVGEVFGHQFQYEEILVGGASIDGTGVPLTESAITAARSGDAVLFGAVGGSAWDRLTPPLRPEKAILGLRQALGAYINLRPGILFPALREASPLKDELLGRGFDLMVVRELTGGIYFGEKGTRDGKYGPEAYDVEVYSEFEVRRIAQKAFQLAQTRRKKVVSVDKANVLESSRLWRRIVEEVAADFPDVELSHMYVDNAAMQVVRDPGQFDVLLTSNLFGDILSDEISMLTGSIGLLPSASLGSGTTGIYEPIHGSAPDLAGLDKANPIGAILSAAMLLDHSLGLTREAHAIRQAVDATLEAGHQTGDIHRSGVSVHGTSDLASIICRRITN
ncbi:3-isopropylmalate dehydrogenase [anaerobic digester metagenome]